MTGLVVTWLLAFARIGALVSVVPVFTMVGIPRWVAPLLALAASLLVALGVPPAAIGEGIGPVVVAMGGEVLAGATMGLGVAAAFATLALGAEISAIQSGLSFSTLVDPLTRSNESSLAVLASWIAGLVFVVLGLPGRCLEIVAASFQVVPPGAAGLGPGTADAVLGDLVACTAIGVQLAGPVLAMVFLVHVFVALLSKLAPKMQAFFSVGMTVTGVVGLGMLAVSVPWLVAVHTAHLVDAVGAMGARIGG